MWAWSPGQGRAVGSEKVVTPYIQRERDIQSTHICTHVHIYIRVHVHTCMCLYRPGHEHTYVWLLVTGAQRPHSCLTRHPPSWLRSTGDLGAWGNACYPLRDALQSGHSVIYHLCDCASGFASHDLSSPRSLRVQKRALARGQWLVHVGVGVPPPEERVSSRPSKASSGLASIFSRFCYYICLTALK